MISFEQGNLLESDAEALVNTVNTVGVMGKGIALMFKDRFPANFKAYAAACERGEVRLGEMFVTENVELDGPRWIVNFPTKDHWRSRTRLAWIEAGMSDLIRVIQAYGIRSIAVPPLGCGNGGLDWIDVKPVIESKLSRLDGLRATVFEPTAKYQNVVKKRGVEELTPARALIAEMIRRYCALGLGCTVLEVQKLAWFISRGAEQQGVQDPLGLDFKAHYYGPYADKLRYILDAMDGSYLGCERRLADAKPTSEIWFNADKGRRVETYMQSLGKHYLPVLEWATETIQGFESPFGMEALATVDWLLQRDRRKATTEDVWEGIRRWGRGGERKVRIFDDSIIRVALERILER